LKLIYFIFLIPITTIAGTARYIPRFNIITEIPILYTSDSAFSISDSGLIIVCFVITCPMIMTSITIRISLKNYSTI